MEKNSSKEYEESMALIDMNHLRFEMPESVCATSNSNRNICNFNPNSYNNVTGSEQLSVLFNVGSSYTDGQKSMLQVTLTVNTTGPAPDAAAFWAFGNNVAREQDGSSALNSNGSLLNLISEINHASKSGDLLYRELYKNQTQTTSRLYQIDKSRRGYLGTAGGCQEINGVFKFPLYPVNQPVTLELPLCELAQFFNTSQLIPPQLLSGSLMRLTIAPVNSALVFYKANGTDLVTAAPTSLNLSFKNVLLYLHQSELYDSVNSLLLASAQSAETNGLQFCYNTVFNTIVNPTAPSFSFDIQLSCAKMSYLILKFIPKNPWKGFIEGDGTANGVAPNKYDPMAAANLINLNGGVNTAGTGDANSLFMTMQVRLGNLIMPLMPVSSSVDMYQQSANCLNPISYSGCQDPDPLKVINKLQGGTISFNEYSKVGLVTVGEAKETRYGVGTGACLFAFSFERASAVNVGGLSSNNARILSVEVNNMARASDFQCIASVCYLQVANVSNENIVINK
jgi:hypothetical protein